MQTLQVIRTIKWIDGLFPDEAKAALFTFPSHRDREPAGAEQVTARLNAALLIGAATTEISHNSDAVAVLQAFGLGDLLDRQFISGTSEKPPRR